MCLITYYCNQTKSNGRFSYQKLQSFQFPRKRFSIPKVIDLLYSLVIVRHECMVNSSHLKNFHLNYVTQQFSTTSQNKCLLSCNMKFCCIQHPSTPVNFKQFILSRIFTNTTRFLANKKVDDNALCKPFFICLLIALNQMVTR